MAVCVVPIVFDVYYFPLATHLHILRYDEKLGERERDWNERTFAKCRSNGCVHNRSFLYFPQFLFIIKML